MIHTDTAGLIPIPAADGRVPGYRAAPATGDRA
jgi:hypothetical protein